MNLGELVSELGRQTKIYGLQAHASRADQNVLIGRRLASWVEKTRCLFSDRITFSPGTSAAFLLSDSNLFTLDGLPVEMISPLAVAYHDVSLEEISLSRIQQLAPAYASSSFPASSGPRYWYRPSLGELAFFPALASPRVSGRISGFYQQQRIGSATPDSTIINLPGEMEQDFIRYCVEALIEPYATGDQRSRYLEVSARNADAIALYRRKYEDVPPMGGPLTDGPVVISLG